MTSPLDVEVAAVLPAAIERSSAASPAGRRRRQRAVYQPAEADDPHLPSGHA
jgi:hypothetical protein